MAEGGGGDQAMGAAPGAPESLRLQSGAPDVFISYASQDAAVADAVVGALERAGLTCWIAPRDVVPGALYADEIVRAINEAKVVVLVLSEYAVASSHVGKEIERASSKHRRILALRTDSVTLTRAFEYFLSESQWIDVGSGGIEAAATKLVDAVRRHLAPVSAIDPSVAPKRRTLEREPATPRRRWIAIAAVAVIAIALAYFGVERFWLSRHAASERPAAVASSTAAATPAISDKSVAVLPFVDMSEKKDQEYFSDGLSEELIDHLAHAENLKVIARTSSFQFKGKNDDMRTIGQRLGVANLLEGSVRTSGNAIRVTAQLINVIDGTHRWSETYDRKMGDIFKIQDEIAVAVVTALKSTMAVAPSRPNAREPTIDSYNELLRGRYFRERVTKQDSERAIEALEDAIRLDPTNATAWVELGITYNMRGLSRWMPPREAYIAARQASDRALVINPNLATAHHLRGTLESNYNYNFKATEEEYRRASELDPSLPGNLHLGIVAISKDQPEKAVELFHHAVEEDPLDALSLVWLAYGLYATARLTQAEHVFHQLLEINSDFEGGRCGLGEVLLAEHKPDTALAVMSKESDEGDRLICMSDALWALGRHAEADALLTQAKSKSAGESASSLADSYALRNDKEEAFKWLNRAYDNHEAQVTLIRGDPLFRKWHEDPLFTALLRKMKLPE